MPPPGDVEDDEGDDEGDDEEQSPQAPVRQAPASEQRGGGEGSGSGSGSRGGSKSATKHHRVQTHFVAQRTANVSAGVDTGTIPQGGIQAGAGGTADSDTLSVLLLGSGALVLVLSAGGLTLRRRGFDS